MGGPEFFWVGQRGGPKFFEGLGRQKGDQNFLTYANGGTRKNWQTGHHKQTAPLPVKNDSSLMTTIKNSDKPS